MQPEIDFKVCERCEADNDADATECRECGAPDLEPIPVGYFNPQRRNRMKVENPEFAGNDEVGCNDCPLQNALDGLCVMWMDEHDGACPTAETYQEACAFAEQFDDIALPEGARIDENAEPDH